MNARITECAVCGAEVVRLTEWSTAGAVELDATPRRVPAQVGETVDPRATAYLVHRDVCRGKAEEGGADVSP